jgi:hypothetical protein
MALRAPMSMINCRGRETRPMPVIAVSNRGRHRQSQVPVFLMLPSCPHSQHGFYPIGLRCRLRTASGEPASMTDEKLAHASAGLTGQVASSRPYPPSFLSEVTERPG